MGVSIADVPGTALHNAAHFYSERGKLLMGIQWHIVHVWTRGRPAMFDTCLYRKLDFKKCKAKVEVESKIYNNKAIIIHTS